MSTIVCPKCGGTEVFVARDMKSTRFCKCGNSWLPAEDASASNREDDFGGDNAHLVRSINALLDLDDAKALVPHGMGKGSHAYRLLTAASARLAALAQSSASPASKGVEVPAGWKLVPVEPTEAMCQAWSEASIGDYPLAGLSGAEANAVAAKADWSAMLAASPTPSNDTLQGCGEVRQALKRIEEWVSLTCPQLPLHFRRTNEGALVRLAHDFADVRAELNAVPLSEPAKMEVERLRQALEERANVACDAECDGDRGRHEVGCVRATAALQKDPSHDG